MKIVARYDETEKLDNEYILSNLKINDVISFIPKIFCGPGKFVVIVMQSAWVHILEVPKSTVVTPGPPSGWQIGCTKSIAEIRNYATDITVHHDATLVLEGK